MSVLDLFICWYCKNSQTLNCILSPGFLKILNQIFSYIFMLKYTDSPQVQGICARAHLQYGDSFYTTNVEKYKKTRK